MYYNYRQTCLKLRTIYDKQNKETIIRKFFKKPPKPRNTKKQNRTKQKDKQDRTKQHIERPPPQKKRYKYTAKWNTRITPSFIGIVFQYWCWSFLPIVWRQYYCFLSLTFQFVSFCISFQSLILKRAFPSGNEIWKWKSWCTIVWF